MLIEIPGGLGLFILAVPLVLLIAAVAWGTRPSRPAPGRDEPEATRLAAVTAVHPDPLAGAARRLATAREAIERGGNDEAAALLRQIIREASGLGERGIEADARLALGDIARRGGDLTSACEHWQLARGLFQDLKRAADLAATEARMRAVGCPTDWVLNDF